MEWDETTGREANAFFTPDDLAARAWLHGIENLKPKDNATVRVLDPCSGGGAMQSGAEMIQNSQGYRSDLTQEWTTVEKYRDFNNHTPTITGDFLEQEFEEDEFDLVMCNPPFKLTPKFINHSMRFAKVGVFILPGHYGRNYFWHEFTDNLHVVSCTVPKYWEFVIGGEWNESSHLKTTIMVIEKREEKNDYYLRTAPIPTIKFVDSLKDATHAIQLAQGCRMRDLSITRRDLDLRRAEPWKKEQPVWIDPNCRAPEPGQLLITRMRLCWFEDFITYWSTSARRVFIDPPELIHQMNRMFVEAGIKERLEWGMKTPYVVEE